MFAGAFAVGQHIRCQQSASASSRASLAASSRGGVDVSRGVELLATCPYVAMQVTAQFDAA